MATTTLIFLFLFLGLPCLIAEYLRAIGSDWPATCTPFEGEAQRWKREREQDEAEPERGWGETADLPPMSAETILRASDERFLEALDNQPTGLDIVQQGAQKAPEDDFDIDTLKRQRRIMRIREERAAKLRKLGLKLETDK